MVTLSSPRLRDAVLSAAYRFNKAHPNEKLNTNHIGLTGETSQIYITEHLSPKCKELFAAARQFCKDKPFKFVWVKYGQVYIRKDEGAGVIRIKDRKALEKSASDNGYALNWFNM